MNSALDVAIIGLAGRFPGARNVYEFWRNLCAGEESVRRLSEQDLDNAHVPACVRAERGFVASGAFLADEYLFDSGFFNMSPAEADITDPQQRVFLECAWEALESAGVVPRNDGARIGVFAGAGMNMYLQQWPVTPGNPFASLDQFQLMLGNDKDYLATRVSYRLNLRGPSLAVQTACSTSLVAVHLAVQSLLAGECDVALAGGVSILVPQASGYVHQPGMILSSDGHCRAFDAKADGTVFGSGVGAVVLKSLARALADDDPVRAVIKGSAINNDGARKVGYAAPSAEGQMNVIADALAVCGLSAETISYVEAHGTGTAVGDPIEVEALTNAFRLSTSRQQFCALGSVKTNIGHSIAAAGIAGLIKTILALEHRQIPASLHFEAANPAIRFETTPFFVNTTLRAWDVDVGPRRAGVSSFGVGGTNAHIILEEAPPRAPLEPTASRSRLLLPLSGKTSTALRGLVSNFVEFIESRAEPALADIAYTAQVGRVHFPFRKAIVAKDVREAAVQLREQQRRLCGPLKRPASPPKIAFMFSGQGTQFAGMGGELYHREAVFAQIVDRCDAVLRRQRQVSLLDALFGNSSIDETELAQPAIYAIECALAHLWMSWGICPQIVVGHSIGEYSAAYVAGAFELEVGMEITAERGRLSQQLPATGAMAAVLASESTVTPIIESNPDVAIAAINSPHNVVISGTAEAVALTIDRLRKAGVESRPLNIARAFHSPATDAVLDDLADFVREKRCAMPTLNFISSVHGRRVAGERLDAAYWRRQMRSPVKFHLAMQETVALGATIFVEVGPGTVLTELGAGSFQDDKFTWTASVSRARDEEESMLQSLATLYEAGCDPDWLTFQGTGYRKVPIPTYCFDRCRHAPPNPTAAPDYIRDPNHPSEYDTVLSEVTHTTDQLIDALRIEMGRLTRMDPNRIDVTRSFLELGLDSLGMLNLVAFLRREYGRAIEVGRFFQELPDIQALAQFLSSGFTEERNAHDTPRTRECRRTLSESECLGATDRTSGGTLAAMLVSQLRLMEQQINALGRLITNSCDSSGKATPKPELTHPTVSTIRAASFASHRHSYNPSPTSPQKHFIDDLLARYASKTAASRRLAEASRGVLADRRSLRGSRDELKQLHYPIASNTARGPRIWDVDSNEYVDVTMGFGVHLFGHNPRFISEVLAETIKQGIQVGPQCPIVGEVAQLFSEMTGMRRVTFCNSGTEAVMTALRLARAASGRNKIVKFNGGYHGHFDGTLALPGSSELSTKSRPMFPGTTPSMVEDVVVLDYGRSESLDFIRAIGADVAGVIVEPVQSRALHLQPHDFLTDLRRLTREADIALIFDEVITGLRVAPGGAQEHFAIAADIATYGKVVGGGMPIGVVAGESRYLDLIDGGDDRLDRRSSQGIEPTYFAGTFCKHPLAMAAMRAVLLHLREAGPTLQRDLTCRTADMGQRLNAYFRSEDVPIRLDHFASIFRVEYESPFNEIYLPIEMDLLFALLILRGIYVWEGRVCFLSTAHTRMEIDQIVCAIAESVDQLKAIGYFRPARAAAVKPIVPDRSRLPLSAEQKRLLAHIRGNPSACVAYNEVLALELTGPLLPGAMAAAVQALAERHDALRVTIGEDAVSQWIAPTSATHLEFLDLSSPEALSPTVAGDPLDRFAAWSAGAHLAVKELQHGPLFRVTLVKLDEQRHVLYICAHQIVCDGWSLVILLGDLADSYSNACRGPLEKCTKGMSGRAHLDIVSRDARTEAAIAYWRDRCQRLYRADHLATDFPRSADRSYAGTRLTAHLPASVREAVGGYARSRRRTLFSVLLTAYCASLHRVLNMDSLVIGISVLGRSDEERSALVGYCSHIAPIVSAVGMDDAFETLLESVHCELSILAEHQALPPAEVVGDMPPGSADSWDFWRYEATFNMDPEFALPGLNDLRTRFLSLPKYHARSDIGVNLTPVDDGYLIEADYCTASFKQDTAMRLLGEFQLILQQIAKGQTVLVNPRHAALTNACA